MADDDEKVIRSSLHYTDSRTRSGTWQSSDEKLPTDSAEFIHGTAKQLDVALALVAADDSANKVLEAEFSADELRRLRWKLDRHLLPLLCLIYTVQFVDKGTIASASILGLIQDTNLSVNEFNNLSSVFFIGYLLFAWPQNYALQKLPVGKWLTFNIFVWGLLLGLHATCKNYAGLCALRFLLGASEGSIFSGLMIVTQMFYTRTEIAERIGWVFQCNGFAVVVSGFLQFGVVHTSPNRHPNQWQWLMIITALLTFATFVLFVLFFPDNPTTARFLSPRERLMAVRRVQANQNGIETKTWKRAQFIEAITDPKTWIMFVFGAVCNLLGGIGVQYSLLIQSFGFTTLQTTLLSIPNGLAQMIGITTACYALRRFPNSRAWISIVGWTPAIIAGFIELFVPFSNKVAHLVGIYLLFLGSSPAFIMMLSWVTSAVSGHTKKTTIQAIFLVGTSVGQILCTQFWREQYRPRDIVPWAITLASHFATMPLTLALHYLYARENQRRDALSAEAERTGAGQEKFQSWAYVEIQDGHGGVLKRKVDKAFLDMTDKENLAFRYVL